MEKMRYNKTFKSGIITFLLCCLLFATVLALATASQMQYKEIIKGMLTTKAIITDISIDYSRYGGYKQKPQIAYSVGGKTYERELSTDTEISAASSYKTNFSVGDTVEIYYNPENPEQIATSLSSRSSVGMMVISGFALAFMLALLVLVIAKRKKFLITEEEYQKERSAKKKEKRTYKNAGGYAIRVQYFNYCLFGLLCVFLMVVSILAVNTIAEGEGTKIISFSEVISMFLVYAVLSSPLWILSLLNRRFFGKIVCAVNESGIVYQNQTVKWEEIDEIEYQIVVPSKSRYTNADCSYAKLVGKRLDIKIVSAPAMIMGKAKKYKNGLNAHYTKSSIRTLILTPLAVVALSVAIGVLFTLGIL